MKKKVIKYYIFILVLGIIASAVLSYFIVVNEKMPISDFEIIADNGKDNNFYLINVGSRQDKIVEIDSQGKIVNGITKRVSSPFKNYFKEFIGSALEYSNGYLYLVRRWGDDATMKFFKLDIVRIDVDKWSDPVVLYSYESSDFLLPIVTNLVEYNDTLYVSLIYDDGDKACIDAIQEVRTDQKHDVSRILSVNAPSNDRFLLANFNVNGYMASLTKGGRVYLIDPQYQSSLIYPPSDQDDKHAYLISVDKFDDKILIYDDQDQRLKYYKNGEIHYLDYDELSSQDANLFNLAFANNEYIPLYFNFDKVDNNQIAKIILSTNRDPNNDECVIFKTVGDQDCCIIKNIEYGNKMLMIETFKKFLMVFSIFLAILLVISFIVYIIKNGKKIVFKFILIIIPILAIAFSILCYIQVNNNKKVIFDLKIANAMTVNHVTLSNLDTSLIRSLRDDHDAYWDGSYKTIYDEIQISPGGSILDISSDVLSKNKVAGIDKNYIFNEVFFVKDDKIYTGVSDKSGYMLPMSAQYFEGTEKLFETLRVSLVPQQGYSTSKYYRGGVYISPIFDNSELIGILATTYDVYTINKFVSNSNLIFVEMAFVILIAISFPIIIMFNIVLKPLKELEKAVNALVQGNYSVKMVNTSNDEFSNIRNIFNKMSEQFNNIIYKINNINDSYFRFVPRNMFAILDKQDILDIKVGDKKNIDCILLSQTLFNFDVIERNIMHENNKLSNVIDFVDRYFNILYSSLKDKQGSLLTNELNLKKIETIFLNNERNAIDFAIDITKRLMGEINLNDLIKLDTSIIIYKAKILYGIVGEQSRSMPFVVSVARNEMNDFLLNFESSGAKLIITEDIKNALSNSDDLNLRYIGFSFINDTDQHLAMYEVLDCCQIAERQQKESSLSLFQNALDLFYNLDFYAARNEFSNVIKISPNDNIARWYLFLCDKYWNEMQTNQNSNANNKELSNCNFNLALYGDKDIKIT